MFFGKEVNNLLKGKEEKKLYKKGQNCLEIQSPNFFCERSF